MRNNILLACIFFGSCPAGASPILLDQRIFDANGSANDNFGSSVAVDGFTLVVGIPGSPTQFGKALVFDKINDTWTQVAELVAPDGHVENYFGSAVDIENGLIVVGAGATDVGGNPQQGAVYLFQRSQGSWQYLDKILAPDGAADDGFGSAVRASSNFVFVGAFNDDIGINADQGSVNVFERNGASWIWRSKLVAPDGSPQDWFGWSIDVSGDWAIIGAPRDGPNFRGSAYAYQLQAGQWTQTQRLAPPSTPNGVSVGRYVAISGNRILLSGITLSGGHSYYLNDSQWIESDFLTLPQGLVTRGVAIGENIFYMTAPGAIYGYSYINGIWVPFAPVIAGPNPAGLFGEDIDVNGESVVVGAPQETVGSNAGQGAAYLFVKPLMGNGFED